MARPLSRAAKRVHVAQRAGFLCEYCHSPEGHSTHPFSMEHIIPQVHGGSDDLDNLALSCQGCNSHKYTRTEVIDPETGDTSPLFHPRLQHWGAHFAWSEDLIRLVGVTPTGRGTVHLLQLNRPGLLTLRRTLAATGEHPALSPLTPNREA